MDRSNELIIKYQAYGLDNHVVKQTYYLTPQQHRDRLLIDENFFFDQYGITM